MDLHQILADLREERDRLDEAIMALEKIIRKQSPRRGRPPKWLAAMRSDPGDPLKKRVSVKPRA